MIGAANKHSMKVVTATEIAISFVHPIEIIIVVIASINPIYDSSRSLIFLLTMY